MIFAEYYLNEWLNRYKQGRPAGPRMRKVNVNDDTTNTQRGCLRTELDIIATKYSCFFYFCVIEELATGKKYYNRYFFNVY